MPPRRHPSLDRYRALHVLSLIALIGGIALAAVAVSRNPWIVDPNAPRPDPTASGLALAAISLGLVGVILGSAMHVARAIVVREPLSEGRYRGPSVIVLLVLAIIAANAASVAVANDVLAVTQGRAPTTLGAAVLLTVTQASLLAVAGLFVAAPRALAGLRFLPDRGLWRSIGLGVVLAVPAWIGAQLLALIGSRLLELVGLRPEEGVAEAAIGLVDPIVLVVALVVVAPIAEEAFFRGIVYNAWLREFGARRAIIGSAALFALIHTSIFLILPIFGLGIALALLYQRTGSLPASMAMHAAFNGITLALGLLVRFDVIRLP
ncbi:MAG TPA: type II CAAX endopeptidase family protein [Candidatus Limnocylindria bacterium]|nr:type II CAAX endopeptidase family protein [Candidatus Limnocylindria bacterium]